MAKSDELPQDNMPVNGEEPADEMGGFSPASLFAKNPGQTDESRLLDAVEAIFSTQKMTVKTVLEEKHIVAAVRGLTFAERYDNKAMRDLVQWLLELRISHRGRSRRDLVAALRATFAGESESDSTDKVRRRLFS